MRRVLALLLLAAFSFPLIAAVIAPDAEQNLPICCRRNGKHHCNMSGKSGHGSGYNTAVSKCPLYPTSGSAQPTGDSGLSPLEAAFGGTMAVSLRVTVATTAHPQLRLTEAAAQRGPPSLPFLA